MGLNLASCVSWSAAECPDKTAVVFEDTRITYAELDAAARRAANALRGLGVDRGDKVAMMLPNLPSFPEVYFGILYLGATVVSINPILRPREIQYRLEHAEAKALVVWGGFVREARAAVDATPVCKHLLVVNPEFAPAPDPNAIAWEPLAAGSSDVRDMVQTQPEDTAVILYTSAMSGKPLGAALSHFNLFQNALISKEFVFRYYPGDVSYAVLPLFHAFGQTSMLNAPLLARGTVIMAPRFEPQNIIDTINREGVTLLAMVPTMIHLLTHYKPETDIDLSSLRAGITGGAPMPQDLAEAFTRRYGIVVLEGYGLTETSPVVSFNTSAETNRPGSVGKPIWGCEVRIEREGGGFADTGETGEIVIRGHNVMKGYYKDPESTAEIMAGDWLHTGDLGHLDEDGYLYITGLKKDMIIRAGMNVYPREVELALEEHPAVTEAAVFGAPDPARGEEVRAVVALTAPDAVTVKALNAHCRDLIASYKAPRKIEIVERIPRTPGGAIDKEALRQRCAVA